MSKHKLYICQICNTNPDQISHHKSHLESQKHKDKRELFEYKLSNIDLKKVYNTTNKNDIIKETETILYSSINKK
jgi:hypothetical protein